MPLITQFGTMPIQEGFHINASDMRVYIYNSTDVPVNQRKRISLGKAVDENNMFPNTNLRETKPDLWEKYYGDKAPLDTKSYQLSAGLYGASLAIGHNYGLYPCLVKCFGDKIANFLMDFAMFSIGEKSTTASAFPSVMKNHVIFSSKVWSDSWISEVFTEKMKTNGCDMFCSDWIDLCIEKGIGDTWICIDGSNCECKCENSSLPKEGHAKSGSNDPIVGYMYAVTDEGIPLAYTVFEGSKHDSTAVEEMITLLNLHKITPKGIIIDRGFCNEEMLTKLTAADRNYIVMLKDNVLAYEDMAKLHSEEIRWKVDKSLDKKGFFGISEKRRLFKKSQLEGFVSFFFDGINAAERASDLIFKTKAEKKRLEELLNNPQKEDKAIPGQKYSEYIKVIDDGSGKKQVVIDEIVWQEKVNAKGFSAIASSLEIGPDEVDRTYHLRDAVEKQFDTIKNDLGYNALKSHSDQGIRNRLFACFIASIIRSVISLAGKKINIDANTTIAMLKDIKFRLNSNTRTYVAIEDQGIKMIEIFKHLGLKKEDFANIANEYNGRDEKELYAFRKLPSEKEKELPDRGRKKKEEEPKKQEKEKRRPGRPLGSKNKKTIEREQKKNHRRGRPLGSKNKPKIKANTS